jgi:arsenate reductase-like glutaredoxin family protein
METNKHELKLYYKSNHKHDRETYGYAQTLDVPINEQDLSRNNLTETQIAELADAMQIRLVELVDKNSEMYMNDLKDKSFDDEELLKLMHRNPELIKTPIAMIGKHTYFVKSPFNLIPKDLEIEGIKSNKGEPSESDNNDTV